MLVSTTEARSRAAAFSKRWKDVTDERAEAQTFWNEFLMVFGVDRFLVSRFEHPLKKLDGTQGFVDVFWPRKFIAEHKSFGKSLNDAYGKQALAYMAALPMDEAAQWVMVSNFKVIRLWNLNASATEYTEVALEDLANKVELFDFIRRDSDAITYEDQADVSIKAAEKMGELHDHLKQAGYRGHNLELLLVRLLFCLFAEDTGIFDSMQFTRYVLEHSEDNGTGLGDSINTIFQVLNTPPGARMTTLAPDLRAFPYVDGGLFAKTIPTVAFDRNMRLSLGLAANLNWSSISPSIFGALFQSVMEPSERRADGAHYTSEESILKVIRPLFLDDLYREFHEIGDDKYRLNEFQGKIAGLSFLDPACGCGNFLTVTYKELRQLEDLILSRLYHDVAPDKVLGLTKVNVGQFFGIESLDFPTQIANTALWLADHQANIRTGKQFGTFLRRLPLVDYRHVVQGNALTRDWEDLIQPADCDYILGNPPFIGGKLMTKEQREEVRSLFGKVHLVNSIDYVSAWYYKASQFIQGTSTRCAFVSTSSICQGQQVYPIWHTLFEKFGITIDFAHRTFVWDSEARGRAHVHVVIVGFSQSGVARKLIYDNRSVIEASNINAYLVDAPNIIVTTSAKPICDVPRCDYGSLINDGGNYIFKPDELEEFLKIEPEAKKYIREFIGSDEFINGRKRYILYLRGASPNDLDRMPEVTKRIQAVRALRARSTASATRATANTPTHFYFDSSCAEEYLIIPSASSERREYVPIGFLQPEVITSNLASIVPGAELFHFGVLTSQMHNSWMRRVAGRLKSDYRYSPKMVYNTFPWPSPDFNQKKAIEDAARAVLDARDSHDDCSLADLYDPNLTPPNLVKAHKSLDAAVEKAYGIRFDGDEDAIAAHLFRLYEDMAGT